VVAQWADHARTPVGLLGQAAALFEAQLDHWPNDRVAWIGDRALALHAYEMIRQGQLALLLTPDERQRFDREGVLAGLQQRLQTHVDQDERFYLRSMRELIESCRQPYYQRRQRLTRLRKRLQAERNTSSFPFAAGRLFLAGVDQAMALQATDRTRMEVWALALALSADLPRPAYHSSPLTGVTYLVDVGTRQVRVVSGTDPRCHVTLRHLAR